MKAFLLSIVTFSQPSEKGWTYNIGYAIGEFVGKYWIYILLLITLFFFIMIRNKFTVKKR